MNSLCMFKGDGYGKVSSVENEQDEKSTLYGVREIPYEIPEVGE